MTGYVITRALLEAGGIDAMVARSGSGLRLLTEEERAADIDTIGGLIFTLAGRVPARGEVISHVSGAEFRVLDSDARRIRRLRAKLPAKDAVPS